MDPILFIHSTLGGPLGCFCLLAAGNGALSEHLFEILLSILCIYPRTGIAESRNCHLCRNHHPLFHSGCTTSPLHQWYIRGPISSHLHLSFMFGFHISHSLSSHETEFKNSLILNGISYFLKQKYGKEEWLTLNSPALCVWHFSCTNSATPQPYHTRAAVWLITTTLWRRQRRSAHFKAS